MFNRMKVRGANTGGMARTGGKVKWPVERVSTGTLAAVNTGGVTDGSRPWLPPFAGTNPRQSYRGSLPVASRNRWVLGRINESGLSGGTNLSPYVNACDHV